MNRFAALSMVLVVACFAFTVTLGGCPSAGTSAEAPVAPETPATGDTPSAPDVTPQPDDSETTTDDDSTSASEPETINDATADEGDTTGVPGVLTVQAFTDSLDQAAYVMPSAQEAPDDIDVRLTPIAYAIAFKRIVLKQLDEATNTVLAEVEVFNAASADEALIVDLLNATAADILDVESLPAGTYNQVDIEVFYLDMTIPTIYPGSESHDIPYRMVYDDMGVLLTRDFLLQLDPAWMEPGSALAGLVTEVGWYWMERPNWDHVEAVAGAAAHPDYPVLDLFANDAFWSQEHRVLEGGRIEPPLEYDPARGGVVTINFDVTETFDFKDFHDETTAPDGLWELRRDAGIHPLPPRIGCVPQVAPPAEPKP